MEKKIKKSFIFLAAVMLIMSACSGPDVSTRVTSSLSRGVLAVEQKVQGKTIIMAPNVEDVTIKDLISDTWSYHLVRECLKI